MPHITLTFALLLILLGLGAYFGTGGQSITAMIPAFFGLPLLLCGIAALQTLYRKHAMHLASGIALLGLLGALGRPLGRLFSGEPLQFNAALTTQLVMGLLCAVLLALYTKSFIDARRRAA
jgi:hypothetical protein